MMKSRHLTGYATPVFLCGIALSLTVGISKAAMAVPAAGTAPPPLALAEAASEEVRAIGTAMLTWLSDQAVRQHETEALGPAIENCQADLTRYAPIDHAALSDLLVPSYLDALPELDPWGHPYDFRLNTDNLLGTQVVALRSPGADGLFEGDDYSFGTTSGPEGDLVYVDGSPTRDVPRLNPIVRQAEVRAEMRNLGTAWMSWLSDNIARDVIPHDDVTYRATGTAAVALGDVDLAELEPVSYDELVAMLNPAGAGFSYFGPCVPEHDRWGHPYTFFLNSNLLASNVLAIRSAGRDGVAEGSVYPAAGFPADDFDRDTVWANGFFVQFPDGAPRTVFADDFETGGLWGSWSETVGVASAPPFTP